MEHAHSSHSHDSHDEHDHGEEPITVKKMAPNEVVAANLGRRGVVAESVALGTHPLESQPCYSHKFSSNPRFTTNKGMIKVRNRNFDLVQVVQKHQVRWMLDANPLPYGALDRYQVHFIVETGDADTEQFLARCERITKGRFGDKRVVAAKWTGAGAFADTLQNDAHLAELLKKVLLAEGEIRVDPLEGHVRIYGQWRHEEALEVDAAMVEVADVIAGHIKAQTK